MIGLLRGLCCGVIAFLVVQLASVEDARAQLVNRDWNTGSGNWNVPGNWTPNTSAPDNGAPVGVTYNVQIGNLPVAANAAVTFVPVSGTSDTIETLIVSGGADFVTNGNRLITNGLTTITGASSSLRVDVNTVPATTSLQVLDLDVTGGGGLSLDGGIASVSADMDITATGVINGFGTLNIGDVDAVVEQAFQNSGLIQVGGSSVAPAVMTIHANGVDTINLDGDNEIGHVDVSNALANVNSDTLTLVVDGPLTDPLGSIAGGLLEIGQRDTVTFNQSFQIATGYAVTMDGGNNTATLNGPGAITNIAGAAFTFTNKAVISNDMTFTGTANTITVNANSSLELGGTVSIADASALSLTSSSELIVSGSTTVTEAAGDFNWDGPGVATTTVKGTGQLNLTVNRVDTTDDLYGGTLNLDDDGDVAVNNTANVWTMAGTLHKRNAGTSAVSGDAVNVVGGVVTVDAAGTLSMPVTTLSPGSVVTVNGIMTLGGGSILAGPTSVTGTGMLRMIGTSTVTANTTINVASFDWDGAGSGTLHTINDGVTFTINSTSFDADDVGDMDDPINLGGNGATLAVNNVPSWTMNRTLTANTSGLGTSTIAGNSRLIMSGSLAILNANGQVTIAAPIACAASSHYLFAALGSIRLDSGGFGSDANVLAGGTINGPGTLAANTGRAIRGFGTIGAPIDFDGTAAIFAEAGTLTINGSITDVGTIGTVANDGILNIPAAWNSSGADFVNMNGGTLQGGTITVANTNGISGFGTVTSRVINNTRLSSSNAGRSLIFETAANDNDWDGAGNTGILAANNASTLEVRDNATFVFGGTVTATGGSRVYAKGFGFNMGATSAINLTASTLQTDERTDINRAINVWSGGDSTINGQVNRFLTIGSTSTVTLNSNLRLVTNNGEI